MRLEQALSVHHEVPQRRRTAYHSWIATSVARASQILLVGTCLLVVPTLVTSLYGMNFPISRARLALGSCGRPGDPGYRRRPMAALSGVEAGYRDRCLGYLPLDAQSRGLDLSGALKGREQGKSPRMVCLSARCEPHRRPSPAPRPVGHRRDHAPAGSGEQAEEEPGQKGVAGAKAVDDLHAARGRCASAPPPPASRPPPSPRRGCATSPAPSEGHDHCLQIEAREGLAPPGRRWGVP